MKYLTVRIHVEILGCIIFISHVFLKLNTSAFHQLRIAYFHTASSSLAYSIVPIPEELSFVRICSQRSSSVGVPLSGGENDLWSSP